MTLLRSLTGPAGSSEEPLCDAQMTLGRAGFVALVVGLRARIAQAGLGGSRICLPLDSTLGTFAALVAVLETDASAVLIPRPTSDPAADAAADWPGFCDAVLMPPDAAAGAESARIWPLARAAGGGVRGMPRGEDRVYLRSSGTTGAPKWAVHDTQGLLANARACVARLGLSPDDRVLIPVPIHHMYGLGAALLPSLLAGATISLVPRGNPLGIFQAQRSFVPTVMFLVPSQCRSLMALNRVAGRARLVVVAGDRLAVDEAAAFEAKYGTLVCLYGSTELGAITAGWPDDPAALRHLTAGPPMEGVTLMLEDVAADDTAETTAEDMVPDMILDGAADVRPMRLRRAAGMLGYADAEGELTTPAPGIWTTGDLVRLHPGARVEVLGRADHAVNRDGLLVHIGEIEACLARIGGVAQAAVVAAGQSRRGVGLVAFCTLLAPANMPGNLPIDADSGLGIVAAEILRQCREMLPARAVPDRVAIVAALPLLASGKVDRRQLAGEAGRL